MLGKYKVIHLLGAIHYNKELFRHVEEELTKQGFIVFAPVIYDPNVYKDVSGMIDEMCFEKLLACDAVCLLTPNHIGKLTAKRLRQAKELGKEIYVWSNDKLAKEELL